MKNYLIADRYATALDHATPDDNALVQALEALEALAEAYTEQEEFRSTLLNPAIQLDRRCAVLVGVAQQIGAPESVTRLADVLMRRGRISLLPDVAALFTSCADRRLNRIGVDVSTPTAMSDAQQDAIRSALEDFTAGTVSVHAHVDKKLLGGAVAKTGSLLIDGSVRSSLRRMREAVMTDER